MTTTPIQDARIRELLLVNLFAVFSERNPERRMRAIVTNYTEDVIWSSPEAMTRGHEELNGGAQRLIDRTPDFIFAAAGPVHVLRDLGYAHDPPVPATWAPAADRSHRPRPYAAVGGDMQVAWTAGS